MPLPALMKLHPAEPFLVTVVEEAKQAIAAAIADLRDDGASAVHGAFESLANSEAHIQDTPRGFGPRWRSRSSRLRFSTSRRRTATEGSSAAYPIRPSNETIMVIARLHGRHGEIAGTLPASRDLRTAGTIRAQT